MAGANDRDEITTRPAVEQLELLRRREVSSRELVLAHLARIQAYPEINAVVATDAERALRAAEAIDAARVRGDATGPLAGLPMTIKDCWEVAGLVSTDGDPRWRHHRPAADAPVVARLRAAGAVFVGKSNVPLHCDDAQTYNAVYGVTRNPWDLARSPGGSSGGAAAALAAGMTPLELGSDIAGSIRLPSAWCGVYGLKTTFGALPATGLVPGDQRSARDMLVPGPMARTARDMLVLYDVLRGGDKGATGGSPSPATPLSAFHAVSWIGMGGFDTDTTVEQVLHQALARLRAAGLRVVDAAPAVDLTALLWSFYALVTASGGLTVDDAAFRAAKDELATAGPTLSPLRRAALEGLTLDHRSWLRLHDQRIRVSEQLERLLQRETDLILVPTVNVTARAHDHSEPPQDRTIQVNGRTRPFYSVCDWNAIASYTYAPAVSIPVGVAADGLPVGLQAIGRRGSDRTLLEFALACEQVLGTPPSPTMNAGRDATR
ncbi:MAG TPA: amidase family protein [Micromonospora sp.]